ncbi:MAG: PepSY-associated TM helix domain-containing protein [Ilumatobacteraceae bacterium]
MLPSAATIVDEAEQIAPRPNAPTRRRGRQQAIRLHRWTGWFLLAWVVFESLTGAYLVVGNDIDRWIHHDRWVTTSGADVGPVAVVGAAQASATAAGMADPRARQIGFPHSVNGVYYVDLQDADGSDRVAYVDPGTGKVNALIEPTGGAYALVLRLHADFNRTEILGIRTTTIVGFLALLWLLNLILGFRASRAHRRTLRQATRIRRGRGPFTFNLDLHKVAGLATIVPLAVLVITGLTFEFPRQTSVVLDAVTPGHLEANASRIPFSTPTAGAMRASLDEVIAGIDASGLGQVQSITIPLGNPTGMFVVAVDGGGYSPNRGVFSTNGRSLDVYVDQYSTAVVKVTDPVARSVGQQIDEQWFSGVHFGQFGSWISRTIWVIAGLATVVLGVTAARMRLVKWSKRRKRAAT